MRFYSHLSDDERDQIGILRAEFGIRWRAIASRPAPKAYLQATAGSQRHFSLVGILPWAQSSAL
jgi:hypothetical protein